MLSKRWRTWERRVFLTSPGYVLLDNCTLLFICYLTVVTHFQALVHMKVLQDRCVVEEGVISHLRKRNETLTNEQDQYKDAFFTLNKEVRDLNEKLKEETHQWKKAEEAKASMEKELMAHFKQVEMARTDAIVEYKASQPFNDACTIYYGEGFNNCLKKVGSVYPDLDFSRVNMDKPLSTPLVKRPTSLFMPSRV